MFAAEKTKCLLNIALNIMCEYGWSDGALLLGDPPVPGRPTILEDSRARAYCAGSRCRWGLFKYFFSRLTFLFSFFLSLGDGLI